MDIKVTRLNGETFTFEENDIEAKDFIVSSIEIRANYDEIEGRHGTVDNGATFGVRSIIVPFYYKSRDLLDFPLLRDFLFRLVLSTEPFYIEEMRRAERMNYAFVDPSDQPKQKEGTENKQFSGKRYLVRLQNTFEVDQILEYGEGELVFETVELPFAESIGTTQDPFTFDADLWQIGQGLIMEDLIYNHSTDQFQIYNAGDVTVDPREIPLLIEFAGASNNLSITNNTTGDVWRYNGSSTESDVIQIDGIRSLKNGSSIFKDTNKKLITIAPGWNDFSISGSTDFTISFDFRFYYV